MVGWGGPGGGRDGVGGLGGVGTRLSVQKAVRKRSTKGGSELSEFRRAFWSFYAENYPEDAVKAGWRIGYARSNLWFKSAHPGIIVSLYLAQREIGVYCTSPWGAPQEDVFPNLEGYEGCDASGVGAEVGPSKDFVWGGEGLAGRYEGSGELEVDGEVDA